jgi:hypothetical protein
MHRAIADVAGIAAMMVAGAAYAANTVTTSTVISSPPDLANISVGTVQTTFVIQPGGSFQRTTGGDFIRIKGNTGSITPVLVTLKCDTQSGSGNGTCGNDTNVTVTVTAGTDTGWPGNVKDFTLSGLSGANLGTPAPGTGATVVFHLNCTGGSGRCSDHQTITFNLGMTMVFNAPPGSTGATNMPFTVSATWQ